jgi:hypothetical protein
MSKTKIVVFVIAAIVLLGSLAFGTTWLGIEWHGFFGPKRQNVEREIFEQTRSYVHGKIQDLTRYRLQYLQADTDSERAAIRSTVRMQFAEFDVEQLPHQELKDFWKECNSP